MALGFLSMYSMENYESLGLHFKMTVHFFQFVNPKQIDYHARFWLTPSIIYVGDNFNETVWSSRGPRFTTG